MKITKAFLTFGAILALVFLTGPKSAPAEEVIEIKAATWHPVTHRLTDDAFKLYGQEITKRSNGKVNFTWLLGGSLVNPFNAYDSLKSGICDWTYIVPGFKPNEFLITSAVNLPFMADNSSHAAAILWRMYHEIPEMKKEYKKIHPLAFFSTSVANLHTKEKAPRSLDDIKGLRIGTPGPMQINMIKALGGSAQQIKPGDLYIALQRGMIQGTFFPDAPLRSYKLTELIGHHTMLNIAVDSFAVSMNRDKWKTLPPETKKIFEDIGESAGALFGATLTNEAQWVNEDLKKRGDEYYYLPEDEKAKWKIRVQPLYKAWVEKVNKRGLDGTALLAKIQAIANETRKTPYQPDDWWGRAGRK
jgi:TRAP-type C4-dicarboxylate transport system substrate-binding protein